MKNNILINKNIYENFQILLEKDSTKALEYIETILRTKFESQQEIKVFFPAELSTKEKIFLNDDKVDANLYGYLQIKSEINSKEEAVVKKYNLPTQVEICHSLGIKSPKTLRVRLNYLMQAGYVEDREDEYYLPTQESIIRIPSRIVSKLINEKHLLKVYIYLALKWQYSQKTYHFTLTEIEQNLGIYGTNCSNANIIIRSNLEKLREYKIIDYHLASPAPSTLFYFDFCGNTTTNLSYFQSEEKKFGSAGENLISQLLSEQGIPFVREKKFSSCVFPKTNYLARFDFWVDKTYIIEFDGDQHLKKEQAERDKYKNQWCKDNNIPLIRIPYSHLKNICINDLLLSTSNFIVN